MHIWRRVIIKHSGLELTTQQFPFSNQDVAHPDNCTVWMQPIYSELAHGFFKNSEKDLLQVSKVKAILALLYED